ncbi:MAG: NAD(P)(+) transhydrogenase (Re/Si-specific) subunit beta [Oscillatoriales cyanobacterium SM2_1_8]|nr:NAD(P)(+) transhydrogenase (Re/Si-specific) subunit beta [Oscillatoriales cyanobacterium SM2_1_8]
MADVLFTGTQLAYLAAASLFIVGLKQLGSPATARNGNRLGAIGMAIAIVATLLDRQILGYRDIAIGLAIGTAVGAIAAYRVAMTAMPQMVGFLNGLGGLSSSLVAIGASWHAVTALQPMAGDQNFSILLGIAIGNVTFSGSVLAFAKLQGILPGGPVVLPFQKVVDGLLLVGFVVASGMFLQDTTNLPAFAIANLISLILGVVLVLPIGGGDMPVVISLLNSLSGLAASAAGFVVQNNALVVSGALVGASGLILTQIMCKAMNRSLGSVVFGGFGGGTSSGARGPETRTTKEIDSEEAAMLLGYARSVAIVPGYGMAVAQAQHAVRELADALEKRGVEVKFAIHPVAGRMPGHMNVLLAEANVPYSQLCDMEDINAQFENVDVALVIGANDVVNPAARSDRSSPIYGMPILEVDKAKHAIAIKRGMSKGFAGVENELFFANKTSMLFGNAKEVVAQLSAALKQL